MQETGKLSITSEMRKYLTLPTRKHSYVPLPSTGEAQLESVNALAVKAGLTLNDWVLRDPGTAMLKAQEILASWENMLSTIAIEGTVGDMPASREMVKAVERAVMNARNDLDTVQHIAGTGDIDELRKDRLIETLYNKALKGDLRAMQYYIDRVEGKIPEMKVQEVDYSSAGLVFSIVHTLFDKQLEVLNSGYGTRMCCCSRRAGKTLLSAAILLIESLRTTNCVCMYISETQKLGEGLLGSAMNEIITKCDLRDSKGNRLNWKRLENGSEIIIRGLSNTKDPDQIRGHKCKVIVIDEFFHLKGELLQYMIEEVLEPMQLDYANEYRLIFIGTPPKTKNTYGQKQWEKLKVPKFIWTWEDNPYIKDGLAYIEDKLAEKGLDIASPYAQREYFAKWVYDDEILLYPDFKTWKDNVPRINIDRVLCGIDYGTDANNAIIAVAWDSEQRRGFEFFNSKFNRLTTPNGVTQLTHLCDEVRQLWEYALDFWPGLDPKEANKRIEWAADNSDGQINEELKYNLCCKHEGLRLNIGIAHKHDAVLMRDKIRELLRKGDLLLMEGGDTALECEMTILKRDVNGTVTAIIDDKAYHPDLLPALRYALWPAIGMEIINNGRSVQDDSMYAQNGDHVV